MSSPGEESKGVRFPLLGALRESWQEGYGWASLQADASAGLVVGLVALPLSMALAIASGVPPQHGLYTAIVAGLVIGLLGGSRVQVSGPTAAFVVILAPIAAKFGLGGLMLATVMAGVLLVIMGVARLGQLIQVVPSPVTSGFTAGIAVVIATIQLKDFFGLTLDHDPEGYFDRVAAMIAASGSARWPDLIVGALTLALLLLWPKVSRKVPAPLVALLVASLLAFGLERVLPGVSVTTIQDRFSYILDGQTMAGIPQLPPLPTLPWLMPGGDGQPIELSMELLRELALPALAIALLGGIESLLSAVIADGMTGHRHDPDNELIAQGLGNIAAPFFGGFAATGAIARTATNVRMGGRSPVASAVHAIFVLLAVVILAPLLGHLPMAAMAALLLLVAWNMSEARHFVHAVRTSPRSDVTVQLVCFGLTVAFDMVIAVTVGIILAAFLFMRRMTEVFSVKLVQENNNGREAMPRGVVLYTIGGPLFFGAAHRASAALVAVDNARALVLDLSAVPAIDATGLVNLRSAIDRLNASGITVAMCGLQDQPRRALERGGWTEQPGRLLLCDDRADAISRASASILGGSAALA